MCKKIRHWLWRWLYRQRWIFFMLALVGVTVFFGFRNSDFRSAFLFDRYGKFQWIGVSAIFAGVGLYLNANLKRQEIKANIIAKNELEVLESFRHDCSQLSTYAYQMGQIMDDIIYDFQNEKRERFYSEKVRELNIIYYKLIQSNNLVKLDSAINQNNPVLLNFFEDLKRLMDIVEIALTNLEEKNYNEGQKNVYLKRITNANDDFSNSASEYVKIVFEQQTDRIS